MKNSYILFSITIPAYKSAFLAEAIESCLAQTYSQFELIIVDDASPENLKEIVERYDDERIRYYRNEKNCGAIDVVDNWNICLNYAKGDYLICIGDDDKLTPNCLQEYITLIEQYPEIGLVHGQTEIIDEQSQFKNATATRPEWETAYSLAWHRWDNRMLQYIGDWCFHTKTLRAVGGFYKLPLAWASDDITAILTAIPKGVANTRNVCFQYRMNSQTISRTGNPGIKMEAILKERKWYEDWLSAVPEDETDEKYRKCMRAEMGTHFDKKFGWTMFPAFHHSIFNIIRYYNKRRYYGYQNRAIGHALSLYLKSLFFKG